MADTFSGFLQKLDRTTAEFSGSNKAQILNQLGKAAEGDAVKAAKNDLGGDAKFSGWPKAELTSSSKVEADVALVGPVNKGVGPWKVAQYGRHHGDSNRFQGPGVNVKTGSTSRTKSGGLRAQKGRKARKWNGYTDPKYTWDDAVEIMQRETPKRAARAVGSALGKVFRG